MCINRNIVECKEGYKVCIRIHTYSINRNIVECKVGNQLIGLRMRPLY